MIRSRYSLVPSVRPLKPVKNVPTLGTVGAVPKMCAGCEVMANQPPGIGLITLPVTEPLFVQIHGPGGAPVACGDIVGPGS